MAIQQPCVNSKPSSWASDGISLGQVLSDPVPASDRLPPARARPRQSCPGDGPYLDAPGPGDPRLDPVPGHPRLWRDAERGGSFRDSELGRCGSFGPPGAACDTAAATLLWAPLALASAD